MTVSTCMASLSLGSNEEQADTNEDYQRAIKKAWTRFIEDLQPDELLDKFIEIDFLKCTIRRNIKEKRETSDKNRDILERVLSSGREKYEVFKECLTSTGQEHLVKVLEEKEKEVADENCNPNVGIGQEVNDLIKSSEEEVDETMPDHQSATVFQNFVDSENIQAGDSNSMKVFSGKKK